MSVMPTKNGSERRDDIPQPSRKRSRTEFEDSLEAPGAIGRDEKRPHGLEPARELRDLKNGLQYVLHGDYPAEVKQNAEQLARLLFGDTLVYGNDHKRANAHGDSVLRVDEPPPKEEGESSIVDSSTTSSLLSSSFPGFPSDAQATKPTPYVSVPPYNAAVSAANPSQWPPLLPPITDPSLQSGPFTHSSTLPTYVRQTVTNCYEPLEFLGDAYIEVIATRIIHARFPDFAVGQRAALRENLVNNETLAVFARAYGFENRVRTTEILKTQGKGGMTKVLADCFEAYVAAVILSAPTDGFITVERWLAQLWAPKIQDWTNTSGRVAIAESAHPEAKKDLENLVFNVRAGTKLEYLEEKPMEVTKENNRHQFFFGVYFTGFGHDRRRLGRGTGRSKAIAGLEAAKDALINNKKLIEELHKKKMEYERKHPRPPKEYGGKHQRK
jgi:dsRNA-specific ribonuclease